ncbi:hypothetical protein OESDEN_03075 [Oesophagostomum dentatum]|uniref:Uncharacterized protein n=1 Tax=Oesophagostomum dentatum TaxID=61180 RepID=A0A0B1TI68_OESDE|nr:hypothetical protein OESDEN_03075 [Oesophagostomum dentatum]
MWSALAVLAIASAVYGELSKNQKRCLLEIEPGNCTEGEDSNGWKRRASEKGGKLFPFGEKKRAKNIVEEVKKKVNEKVASKEVREAFAQAKSKKDEKALRKTLEKEVAKAIKKAIITEKSKRAGKMGKEEKHDKIHEEITIVERRKPKLPSFGIKFGTKKILPFKDDVTVKIFTAVPKIFINQDRTSGPKLVKFEPKDKSNPCHAPIKTGRCKAAHKR